MIFRLKTSKKTENMFMEIKNKLGITPNILCRIAVSLSLKKEKLTKQEIKKIYKKIDHQGIEFQRHTLVGENEVFYKVLMENYCNDHLTDKEFFPIHFKYHLETGMDNLKSEIEIASNLDSFVKNLINL